MTNDRTRRVPLGKLVAGHGVRGLAKIKPFNPDSETLTSAPSFWLEPPPPTSLEARHFEVESRRPHKGLLLFSLRGIHSLDDLEPWIGSQVSVDESELSPLEPGEFYQYRALGLEVRTEAGAVLGKVKDILATGANDVWVIQGAQRGDEKPTEILIPVVGEIVIEIDLEKGYAVVRPIPGLLQDANA